MLDGPVRCAWLRRLATTAGMAATLVVLATAANGCGSKDRTRSSEAATSLAALLQATDAEVSSLLAGIQQRGATLGVPTAPVTVQYFGDLQCPYCRRFTLTVLPALIRSYVRSGKLKIVFRSLQSATRNPETFQFQQIAALAAGKQNKMWNFIDLFYREQGREDSGYVTERYLQGLAQQVGGLNLIEWTGARSDPALANVLAADAQAARNAGLSSTPSFLLVKTGHAPYTSAIERQLTGRPG
jgi:protein-disulfide isomerase